MASSVTSLAALTSSVTSLDGLVGLASSVTSLDGLTSSVTSLDGLAGMASSVISLYGLAGMAILFKKYEIWSIDSQEKCKKCCHQMSVFKAKMHQNQFRAMIV